MKQFSVVLDIDKQGTQIEPYQTGREERQITLC